MSNLDEIRKKAISLANQATEEDRKENYESAYQIYKQVIKYFMHLQKCNH